MSSATLFIIQTFSKPTLTVYVEIDLYSTVRPWGNIRDVYLETASNIMQNSDNITQTYNSYKPIGDFSYDLFFTLNESSSDPINWTYRIADRFNLQGDYKGHVVCSVEAKGRYLLTIELVGYISDLEETHSSFSRYVEIL